MSKNKKPSDTPEIKQPTPEEIAEVLDPGNDNLPPNEEEDLLEIPDDIEPDPFLVLERLHSENEDLKNQVLRAAADMQNLRKRTDREKAEASKYASTAFARDIIAVADNMSRATAAVPAEDREANDAVKNLLSGVELTERELLQVFRRHGIERIDPKGDRFDPNFHDAVFEVPDKTVPSGTVVEVAQCGYRLADRVLRPAMVGVSKGGPKAVPKSEGDEPDAQNDAD